MSSTQIIEYPLQDGTSVLIEVADDGQQGNWRDASTETVLSRANDTLESAIERVKPAAQAIISRLSTLSERPTEIELEFGIKFSAQAGAIIASGSVEANYVVKLKWTQSG